METGPSLWERFDAKVERTSSCWLWCAARARNGYGLFNFNGQMRTVHRVAHERWKGPIPPGLTIDHLCRNRACVNPDHLEVVSQRENVRRGLVSALRPQRVECRNGHRMDPGNRYMVKSRTGRPRMECRACHLASMARYRAKRRQAALQASEP